jgi:hypothetical protein
MGFQSLSSKQGYEFESLVEEMLKDTGWVDITIHQKLPAVEVDFIAHNNEALAFYFSAKGSERGSRPGIRRTDTFSKAVGEAYYVNRNGLGPYLIVTSHLPTKGSGIEKIKLLEREMVYDILELPADKDRLRWLCKAPETEIRQDMRKNPSLFNVIVKRKLAQLFTFEGYKP